MIRYKASNNHYNSKDLNCHSQSISGFNFPNSLESSFASWALIWRQDKFITDLFVNACPLPMESKVLRFCFLSLLLCAILPATLAFSPCVVIWLLMLFGLSWCLSPLLPFLDNVNNWIFSPLLLIYIILLLQLIFQCLCLVGNFSSSYLLGGGGERPTLSWPDLFHSLRPMCHPGQCLSFGKSGRRSVQMI